ncbi:MAG: cyclic nucleotide-binding/CBS domain-containing protein [Acidobacteria bacterium]|nr:cyclic nucleotide-binding/CBS domain-containing protein [Acidobacteriota bacterium]
MEPLEFLRRHPPFDRLTDHQLQSALDGLEVSFSPRGDRVLRRGGPRGEHLYVIRKGAVRLERDGQQLMALEEGDCFGFPSLIGRASPLADAVAAEDTLLYRLPEAVFTALLESSPSFAEFFLLDLAGRLRRAAEMEPMGLGSDLAIPARRLAAREPVFVAATATVGEAARLMRAAGTGAVLVSGPGPELGILTDRDLRTVLASGHGPDLPVARAMTRPVRSLPAAASLFEVLLFMLEHRVRHAPLAADGKIVGLIGDTDLLRLHLRSPLHLMHELARLRDPGAAAGYARELAAMVEVLAWGGADAAQIGRIVSRLNDALTASLLRLAEAELGPPPCPYAWIVLGSEGRMEQALLTDQDNALVWEQDSPAAGAYFGQLAERGVSGLLAAGFPPCPGGFMATRWGHPLAWWRRTFQGWVEAPQPQALVEASSFFDFRPVHGSLGLAALDEALLRAGREGTFMAQLAKTALGFRPPLGAFHQLRADHGGVDLKAGGIMPIVGLARLHGLAAGSRARPTLERLATDSAGGADSAGGKGGAGSEGGAGGAAAGAGMVLSQAGAATLAEAFRFLLRVRLRTQIESLRRGEPPPPASRLQDLSALERQYLKETFLAIREIQEAIALRYGVR